MKKFIFYLVSVLASWLLILPFAIVIIHTNIYSLEGLFKLNYYWNTANIVKLSITLAITAALVMLIIKCVHLFISGIPRLSISTRFFEYTHTCVIKFCRVARYKWFFPIVLIMISLIVLQSMMGTHHISLKMRWFEKNYLVAHAAGGIDFPDDRRTLTNTKEAFESNYEKGHRVFEIDMYMTADNVPVAEHDWLFYYSVLGEHYENEEDAPPVYYNEFIKNKYNGKYTALDINKMIELMVKYDDAYIMTDFKHWYDEEKVKYAFKQIVDTAHQLDCPEVLDRIIVQVYHYDFFSWINSIHKFENYLFTCYAAPKEQRNIHNLVEFCSQNDIGVITIPKEWLSNEYVDVARKHNMRIYVHTENELTVANEYVTNGAAGIYTDFLTYENVAVPEMSK